MNAPCPVSPASIPDAVAEFDRAVDALIADHAALMEAIERQEQRLNRIAETFERLAR